MLEFVVKAKQYMWDFVELAFVAVLGIMLIYLVLGKDSGVFVLSVAGNVIKFTNDVPAGNLVAFAIVGALLYWFAQKNRSYRPLVGPDISQLLDRALRQHIAMRDKPVRRADNPVTSPGLLRASNWLSARGSARPLVEALRAPEV